MHCMSGVVAGWPALATLGELWPAGLCWRACDGARLPGKAEPGIGYRDRCPWRQPPASAQQQEAAVRPEMASCTAPHATLGCTPSAAVRSVRAATAIGRQLTVGHLADHRQGPGPKVTTTPALAGGLGTARLPRSPSPLWTASASSGLYKSPRNERHLAAFPQAHRLIYSAGPQTHLLSCPTQRPSPPPA